MALALSAAELFMATYGWFLVGKAQPNLRKANGSRLAE
jgi:hypothetical protein